MQTASNLIDTEFRDTSYSTELRHEYAKIYKLLEDPDLIERSLLELEKQIATALKNKGVVTDEGLILPKPESMYINHYHVLSELSAAWAAENNFNQSQAVYCISVNNRGEEERTLVNLPAVQPSVIGVLSPDVFNAFILALGYVPKDIGAGPSHGEFSHFIQLFIVQHANTIANLLKIPLVDLIKHSADYMNILSRAETPWSMIFDSPPTTANFHSADFINQTMIETIRTKIKNSPLFPCLSALLKGRVDKRAPHFRQNPTFFPQNLIPSETYNKYQHAPGIIINEAIYFPTPGNNTKHYIYDDITHECILYKNLIDRLQIDLINPDSIISKADQENHGLIKTLIQLCNKGMKYPELIDSLVALKEALLKLQHLKDDQILHQRDVIQLFKEDMSIIQTFSKDAASYYASVVTYAIETLNLQNRPQFTRNIP